MRNASNIEVFSLLLKTLVLFILIRVAIPESIVENHIRKHGYPVESHYVTTLDGYILNLHRIPTGIQNRNKRKNKVVYLLHGLMACSMQWLFAGPEKSLGYILADEGYDVWLGNDRGNEYSRNHTRWNPNSDWQFWNFSFHEMGIYDNSAAINYILNQTNQSGLYHLGHSQGTTSMYVLLSMLPEFNEKIIGFIHLGPAAFMGHLKSIIFTIPATLMDIYRDLWARIENSEVILLKEGTRLGSILCTIVPLEDLCLFVYSLFSGCSAGETNIKLVSGLVGLVPSGGSIKELFHILQAVLSGKFRQYDYGTAKNYINYGQVIPPSYNLSKITARGYLLYGENDDVSDRAEDVPALCNALRNCEMILVPVKKFSHLDFMVGKSSPKILYPIILKLLDQ